MRPAGWCWVGLAIYVTLADAILIYGRKAGMEGYCTMSQAFEDALHHPVRRWPVVIAWSLVTFHLFDAWLPDSVQRIDPIGWAGSVMVRRGNG